MTNKDYDCHCWNDYPNENHKYYGCSDTPKKSGKWKCVDCYEYVGKSKFGATHCRKKNKGVMIMTIDEAIQKARDNENSFKNNHKLNLTLKKRSPYYGLDCLKISEDNKHLAEWLEELKAYRANEGMSENVYRCGYKFGYNKAVDDYRQSIETLEKAYKERNYAEYEQILFFAKEIAEQLKGTK